METVGHVFALVLTDNGSEFSDKETRAHAFRGRGGLLLQSPLRQSEGRLREEPLRDPEAAIQVQGYQVRPSHARGCPILMSGVNSEFKRKIAWLSPCEMLVQIFREDGLRLLDAFGIESVAWTTSISHPGAASASVPKEERSSSSSRAVHKPARLNQPFGWPLEPPRAPFRLMLFRAISKLA